MEEPDTLQDIELIQQPIQTEIIELDNKIIQKTFMISMPNNSVDFRIICDILNPNFITEEMKEDGKKEYVGAVSYFVNEHDRIRTNFVRDRAQISLSTNKSVAFMLSYLDKTKLKIIDPNNEFLRIGNRYDRSFERLSRIPPYLNQYLRDRRERVEDDDILYMRFWNNLFSTNDTRKRNMTNYISWEYSQEIDERNGNIFLPPVPFIKRNLNQRQKDSLLLYTAESNKLAYQLYGDRSTFYSVFNCDLFKDTESINTLNNMIAESKNKFLAFKILYLDELSQSGFGFYAKKNLELFLNVLKDIKLSYPDKVIGILNGGGFGYSLFNVVFDFFTDTISNYPTESFARHTGRHRGLMHPITFAVEPIEGVLDQMRQHRALFLDNSIADKYKEKDILKVDKKEWSVDCRKMALIMWQKRVFAKLNTQENHVFDEVFNSDYSYLGTIVKNLLNN